ncbi:integrase core domain-containing protein [Salisediminibacterium selenitireducens]|nr:integrase core domain-containing protein [Salisediminibacterium selenitireducens]
MMKSNKNEVNQQLILENISLRAQLAHALDQLEKSKSVKRNVTPEFKLISVFLMTLDERLNSVMTLFRPETVIRWQRELFAKHHAKRSVKKGRPCINQDTINLILKIHNDNPLWSPEKIHEQFKRLNIRPTPSPNTIAKYLPKNRKPPSEWQRQSYMTFLKNHSKDIWAADFFSVPTLTFHTLYVLVIIHHHSRQIKHIAVTTNPTAEWTVQQFRNATPYGEIPVYLIHDNDSIFRSKLFQRFLTSSGIKSKRTAIKSPWQNPYAERVIGTIKREVTDFIIPFHANHLDRLLQEYVHEYYNTHRTHQGINGQTPIPSPEYPMTDAEQTILKKKPVLNGLYYTYSKSS